MLSSLDAADIRVFIYCAAVRYMVSTNASRTRVRVRESLTEIE